MGNDSLGPPGVVLVAVAVVLRHLWWLRIGNLLNELGADVRRLVEVIATLRTAVIGDLNFSVWVGHRPPLWIVSFLSAGSTAIGSDIIVVIVLRGRGLVGPRPSLAGWCVWIFVLPKA